MLCPGFPSASRKLSFRSFSIANGENSFVQNFSKDHTYALVSGLTSAKSYDGKFYAHLWYRIGNTWHCAGDGGSNCAIFYYVTHDGLE